MHTHRYPIARGGGTPPRPVEWVATAQRPPSPLPHCSGLLCTATVECARPHVSSAGTCTLHRIRPSRAQGPRALGHRAIRHRKRFTAADRCCVRLHAPWSWCLRGRGRRNSGQGGRGGEGGEGMRQLLGAADAQTAHPATTSTAPAHQRRGSANAETTPAGAPAAAADRTQRPDATREGKTG